MNRLPVCPSNRLSTYLLISLLVSLISIGATLPSQAQDLDKIQITPTKIAENVYTLVSNAGGNVIGCAGDDGVLLVDSDYTQLSDKLKAALSEISDLPTRYICNTHWHFDHVGGNENFAPDGTIIVAHNNVRKRMAKGQLITIIGAEVAASPAIALPSLTFQDGLTLHMNGQGIVITHHPRAHTDGDASVFFKQANVMHTGDLVFNDGYPFVDISSGGNIDGVIAALTEILSRCDDETQIIPGHGQPLNKGELTEYRDMLQSFRDIVASEKAAGKSLATIQQEQPTSELDQIWDNQFPASMFTEMVYLSLE